MFFQFLKLISILVLIQIQIRTGNGAATPKNFTQLDADHYLAKYGYLGLLPSGTKTGVEGALLEEKKKETRLTAIRQFQRYAGLPVSGKLDDRTIRLMKRPRCGRRDVEPGASLRDATSTNRDTIYKWDQSSLQWTVKRPSSQLDNDRVRSVLTRALDVWSRVVPLDFAETSSEAEPPMQVGFGRGQHGDAWPFDGQGNVLAHASYPKDGRLHFDDDEKWVIDDFQRLKDEPESVDLYSVAVHEIGHALGLFHSDQREAIMYPIYMPPMDEDGREKPVELSQYDIRAIQNLYGPRTGGGTGSQQTPRPTAGQRPASSTTTRRPGPTSPTRPAAPTTAARPAPTLAPTGAACPNFQAAVTAGDGATYFFSGNQVWKKAAAESASTTSTRYRLDQLFPGAPADGPTDALTTLVTQLTILIRGRRTYAYSYSPVTKRFTLQEGYPKDLPDNLQFEPQGAVKWRDGNLVLYKGDDFVIWDDYWNSALFNGKVSSYFANLPTITDASFAIGSFRLYFLRGQEYKIYDMKTQEISSSKPLRSLLTC